VQYFRIVLLPAQIADIAYRNKAVIYDILFKASAETLITIAADPKHLGARIGILPVPITGARRSPIIRTSTRSCRAAAARSTPSARSPAGQASSSPYACSLR